MALRPSYLKADFKADGYCVSRGVFSREECERYIDHYMELRKEPRPGDYVGFNSKDDDPWRRYPRMIHMHRWDEVSLQWMIDPRLNAIMTGFLGEEPLAVQTMLYFKAPGARGQDLHQDQFYLRAKPGTCVAAWLALERADEENGCIVVVPGTQDLPLLCTVEADHERTFSEIAVPLAEGMKPVPMELEPGDVLFFNGSLVHGSGPNTTKDRFRRSLIGHYVTGNATEVSSFYHPVLRMDGTQVDLEVSPGGGPCGVWTDSGLEMREKGRLEGPEHE